MSDNEEAIIYYGKRMLLQILIVFVISLLVGIILQIPVKVVIFLVCLMPLRHNAGGVHMSSKCFLCDFHRYVL